MRALLPILFLSACAHPWAEGPRPGEVIVARVARVVDGDTLDLAVRGHPVRVRLLGVDTPERGQPGWAQARDSLALRLGNRARCTVGPRPRDAFGRLLATCERAR